MLTIELTVTQAIYHNQTAKTHSKVNVAEVISLIRMTCNKHFLCDGYSLSNLVLPENTCAEEEIQENSCKVSFSEKIR